MTDVSLRVLRVYHSAVVTGWRERDRELRSLGCDVRVVTARRWNEGGRDVAFDAAGDDFVVPAATLGRHPYRFVFDPVPVIRELRVRPLDLLDIHEEPASLAAFQLRTLARAFQKGVPIVYYGAQNIEKRFPVPFRWIERAALRDAAGAHTCNSDAGRIFVAKGLKGATRTIGLGVDIERFAAGAEPSRREPCRVGYVGRLEPHKGVDVLLRAVARLPHVRLVVCGSGSNTRALVQLADALGIDERVEFIGHVAYADLPAMYRSFDVVAIPSLRTPTWVEQFGRVAVEAMAAGVPVVASDEGSLRDVIGDAGVFARAGDVDAWHIALGDLADHDERRRNLRAAGLTRAREFSWRAIATEQLDFYREVAR